MNVEVNIQTQPKQIKTSNTSRWREWSPRALFANHKREQNTVFTSLGLETIFRSQSLTGGLSGWLLGEDIDHGSIKSSIIQQRRLSLPTDSFTSHSKGISENNYEKLPRKPTEQHVLTVRSKSQQYLNNSTHTRSFIGTLYEKWRKPNEQPCLPHETTWYNELIFAKATSKGEIQHLSLENICSTSVSSEHEHTSNGDNNQPNISVAACSTMEKSCLSFSKCLNYRHHMHIHLINAINEFQKLSSSPQTLSSRLLKWHAWIILDSYGDKNNHIISNLISQLEHESSFPTGNFFRLVHEDAAKGRLQVCKDSASTIESQCSIQIQTNENFSPYGSISNFSDGNEFVIDDILASEWGCIVLWSYLFPTQNLADISLITEIHFNFMNQYAKFKAFAPDLHNLNNFATRKDCERMYKFEIRTALVVISSKFFNALSSISITKGSLLWETFIKYLQCEIESLPLALVTDCETVITNVLSQLDNLVDGLRVLVALVRSRIKVQLMTEEIDFVSFTKSHLYHKFILTSQQFDKIDQDNFRPTDKSCNSGDIVQLLRATKLPFYQKPSSVSMSMIHSQFITNNPMKDTIDAVYKFSCSIGQKQSNGSEITFDFSVLLSNNQSLNHAMVFGMIQQFLIPEVPKCTNVVGENRNDNHRSVMDEICYNFIAGSGNYRYYGAVWRYVSNKLKANTMNEIHNPAELANSVLASGICIVSKYPLVNSIRQYLANTINKYRSECTNIPQASLTSHAFQSSDQELNSLMESEIPIEHEIYQPVVDTSMGDLFECLSITHIIRLFALVLQEKQIIFVSSSYSILISVAEAIRCLIYPLVWSHVYIPILPVSMKEYLHCPTPFIFGLHQSYVRQSDLPKPSNELVIVNLNADTLTGGGDINLPSPKCQSLRHKLFTIYKPRLITRDLLTATTQETSVFNPAFHQHVRQEFRLVMDELLLDLAVYVFRFKYQQEYIAVIDTNRIELFQAQETANFFIRILQSQAFSTYTCS